jgi:hypothetical protein
MSKSETTKTKLFRQLEPGDKIIIEDLGEVATVLDQPRKGLTYRMLHISFRVSDQNGWCEMDPDAVVHLAGGS